MCNEENKKKRMTSFSYVGVGEQGGKEVRIKIDNKKMSNEQLSSSNTYLMKIKNLKINSIVDATALAKTKRYLSMIFIDGLSQMYSTKSQIHVGEVMVNNPMELDVEFVVGSPFDAPFYVTAEIPELVTIPESYLAMSLHISFEPLD